jgi:hypothetical protein
MIKGKRNFIGFSGNDLIDEFLIETPETKLDLT